MAKLGKNVKGKSKKGKKDAGSAEDKALQDKIKRMEENDYQKRLAAAKRKELQERLELEQKYTAWNRLKIQNTWRKIMRLAKVESLRKDIEIISQTHERDVDRKDAIIQMLDRDLEEAEEQYQVALRSHLQNIDRLIDLQDSRLLALENEFEADLRVLDAEFQAERDAIREQHARETGELNDLVEAVTAEEAEKENESRQEFEQMREMIRNKNLEDIHVLQSFLDNNIEDLERNFETAHLNYLQNTDQRTQDFKNLTQRDQTLTAEIDVKIRKIDRLQASLSHWRTKINTNNRECEERNKTLEEEKAAISKHFQELKARMHRFRAKQAKRLTQLTKDAGEVRGTLGDRIGVAERVLKLAERARKLETDREKVAPFLVTPGAEDDDGEAAAAAEAEAAAMEAADGTAKEAKSRLLRGGDADDEVPKPTQCFGTVRGAPVAEWNYLDVFFKKFNKVLLDKLAMERERDRLRQENGDLQSILQQYLEGISVTEDALRKPNPLLVINGRLSLNQPPVRRAAPATVVEAAMEATIPGARHLA
uniref:Dynein regulatory complex subunit 2 n=1 Tax=Bicosoecida sp. CB-2014 TaxID=1486930 RepID=A0A7S1CIL1_9STRA